MTEKSKIDAGKKLLKEFEYMRDMAELRALSTVSLAQPLNDAQFKRMKHLADLHDIRSGGTPR